MRRQSDGSAELAGRVRMIREESFGERGPAGVAEALGIAEPTWRGYESGEAMPAHILLGFIELTGANPAWLLHGRGERYGPQGGRRAGSSRGISTDRISTP
jgi:hypothetical protein